MQVVIYFCVAVSIFLLAWAAEMAMQAMERYYRIKETREDNAALRQSQRAMDKKMRRLESKLSAQGYQRSSTLEQQLQKAQAEISNLRMELKIKESLIRAVDSQIMAKVQEVNDGQ